MAKSLNYAKNGRVWKPSKKPLSPTAYADRQFILLTIHVAFMLATIITVVIVISSTISNFNARGGNFRELIEYKPGYTPSSVSGSGSASTQ